MIEFSTFEKSFLFILLGLTLYSGIRSYKILFATIKRGRNNLSKITVHRTWKVLTEKIILLLPTWKTRFWSNLFHIMIVWGFLIFLIINIYDLLNRFFPTFTIPSPFAKILFPLTDIFSGLIIAGVFYFSLRRLFFHKDLMIRGNVKLIPDIRKKINQDSAIVIALIFIHVTSRILAESLKAVYIPNNLWLPITNTISSIWIPTPFVIFFWKVFSWSTLISLFLFIPYFPYSKHFHLMLAPINYLLKQDTKTLSAIQRIDFEDETQELFGAVRLEELESSSILDSYACIMCCRCQNVCPPYNSGSELSPAAFEINKRYYLNQNFGRMNSSSFESLPLTEFAITEKAVWDCTTCGACVNVCPVGIDPLSDILQIRRHLVLMQDRYPKSFQVLFKNLERYANPWGIHNIHRLDWAAGHQIRTVEQNPDPDILWWVGCAGAYDSLAQKSSLAFLNLLNHAEINFSVLGQLENCTGDSARRAGKEDLFYQLATANVEILNEINPKRIVTSCAHCYHVLKNEYSDFGGNYDVIHSSELLLELLDKNKLVMRKNFNSERISFQDPCYLSRFNYKSDSLYSVLEKSNCEKSTSPFNHSATWCCGAGGSQIWKEPEYSEKSINDIRFEQLTSVSTKKLITACPFCKSMLSDANQKAEMSVVVQDLSEYFIENIIMEN